MDPAPVHAGGSQALSPFSWEMLGQTGCPAQLAHICSPQMGGAPHLYPLLLPVGQAAACSPLPASF